MNHAAPPRRSAAAVAVNALKALDQAGIDRGECDRFIRAEGFAERAAGREPLLVSDLVDMGARLGVPASQFLIF